MSKNTEKAWILMRYFEWEKTNPPIEANKKMGDGFMVVFDSKEKLMREFPDAEYMEIERYVEYMNIKRRIGES